MAHRVLITVVTIFLIILVSYYDRIFFSCYPNPYNPNRCFRKRFDAIEWRSFEKRERPRYEMAYDICLTLVRERMSEAEVIKLLGKPKSRHGAYITTVQGQPLTSLYYRLGNIGDASEESLMSVQLDPTGKVYSCWVPEGGMIEPKQAPQRQWKGWW